VRPAITSTGAVPITTSTPRRAARRNDSPRVRTPGSTISAPSRQPGRSDDRDARQLEDAVRQDVDEERRDAVLVGQLAPRRRQSSSPL